MSSSSRLVRDGKLDREATVVDLRVCLDTLLAKTGFRLSYRVELPPPGGDLEAPEVVVDFEGPDQELLLEHGAELLKALEYIAVRWLHVDPQFYDRVRFDSANYRADHLAELKLSAQVAAERVRETHMPFRFNPMGARERRIIHLVLKDKPGIRTASEGVGDERRLVVFPDNKK
jgi:spoIIIJ-associated protein